jgi:outer membrane protein assembly factor BamA
MNIRSTGFLVLAGAVSGLSLVCVQLSAQEKELVRTIEVRGVTAFPEEEIVKEFVTEGGRRFVDEDFQLDLVQLAKKYLVAGYLHSRIDSVATIHSPGKIDLIVFLFEGKQTRVDTILIEGCNALRRDELRAHLPFGTGSVFTQSVVETGAQNMLKVYEAAGYPFAKVTIDSIGFSEAPGCYGATIAYKIDEGKQLRISELRIEGNSNTRNSVIVREARLTGNEYYSEELANRVRNRLERLQLFSSVSTPELFVSDKEEGGLLVRVEESNPNRFDGILGYVPSPRAGESGYFTGLVDLQLRNLFGTARRLSARWFREDRSSQEIGLRYFEPWIASIPLNGEVGFVQRIQDSTYVRRSFDLSLDFKLNEALAIGAVVSRTNVIPSESYGSFVLGESQSTSVGVYVAYDTRNDPITPLSGLYYRTEYDLGSKFVTASMHFQASSNSVRKILLDLDYYLETVSRQIIAAEVHIRDFQSGSVELADLYRLGGATTLRGYREGQFLGSRLVWSNLEYRFLVERRSYLYGFFDTGYIDTPVEPLAGLSGTQQTKIGYGVGFRLDTKLGLIGVSLGMGEGDTFSTAKLHIRLINVF